MATKTVDGKKVTRLSVLTRREYFLAFCTMSDLAVINRMFWKYALGKCSPEDPIWIKEEVYERWLTEQFNPAEWDEAKEIKSEKGSIPRGVFDSWSLRPMGCH